MSDEDIPSPETRSTLTELADLSFYQESAWLRVRFALWRGIGLLVLLYGANVLVNAIEIAIRHGSQAFSKSSEITQVFYLNDLLNLGKQFPSIAFSFIGILLLGVFLSISARLRNKFRTNADRKQIIQRFREFRSRVRQDARDDDAFLSQFAETALSETNSERIKRYREIEQWLRSDDFLVDQTDHLIRGIRFFRDLLVAVVSSAAIVVAARLVTLFR